MIDVLDAFRAATAHFGVSVIVGAGAPVDGLLDRADEFTSVTGVPVAHGGFVLQVARGAFPELALGDELLIDGAPYVYRGPVDGAGDLATQALTVVPRKGTPG